MEPIRLLEPDGTLRGEAPVGLDEIRQLFAALVTARTFDHKGSALQRQGRLATYAPFAGQEAAQIGSAAALRPDDWMVATYRDAAAMWLHGYRFRDLLLRRIGDERGSAPPAEVPVLPPSVTVGAHMVHAVGLAWAERHRGTGRAAITYFGDGATSEGDFHEAMNFAAVFGAPVVFVCENNGWAISMPTSGQTAATAIADKAAGYGMPGIRVDGNDVLAMYRETAAALDRARDGAGPTLIEAVTYRVGPHTTTDDPGRYRDPADVEDWLERDPLERVRRYLERAGAWDRDWEDGLAAQAAAEIEAEVAAAESLAPPGPGDLFATVYADPTSDLETQLDALRRDLGEH